MKLSACQQLRSSLARAGRSSDLWVTLESPAVTEMAVALGLDWVVIDAEHGHLDWKEIAEHIRATVRSNTVALVRITELNVGLVKRSLDIGADGVVIRGSKPPSSFKTQCVSPAIHGGRSRMGAERATAWGQALAGARSRGERTRLRRAPSSRRCGREEPAGDARSRGRRSVLVWPGGLLGDGWLSRQWEGPGVAEEILRMKDAIRAAGKHCGVVATGDDNVQKRLAQEFGAIALGMDTGCCCVRCTTRWRTWGAIAR